MNNDGVLDMNLLHVIMSYNIKVIYLMFFMSEVEPYGELLTRYCEQPSGKT